MPDNKPMTPEEFSQHIYDVSTKTAREGRFVQYEWIKSIRAYTESIRREAKQEEARKWNAAMGFHATMITDEMRDWIAKRHRELQADMLPDVNCYTLPDGSCEGSNCMHDTPPATAEAVCPTCKGSGKFTGLFRNEDSP